MQITVKYGVRAVGDLQSRAESLDQLLSLVDFILAGRRSHVDSLRDATRSAALQQYEADRLSYIQLFIAEEEYERAAMLAEKYLDFQILIDVCQKTNNKEKINYYIDKFKHQGFSKFLFSWYIREQKQSCLVQHCNENGGEELDLLLREHPSLSWLHDVARQQYIQASDTLRSLARAETRLLQRKKTQLSLAKLCLLASSKLAPDTAEDELSAQLSLIAFQENLPESLITSYGYDVDNMRLFLPSELIKLYISDENTLRTEFTFKTALDILSYVEDNEERCELNNEIWCKAVMKDSWTDMDPNSPQSTIQQLIFFRLVELCMLEGCEDMVPSIEKLLSMDELGSLKENRTFHYLLQVGYEHFTKDSEMVAL